MGIAFYLLGGFISGIIFSFVKNMLHKKHGIIYVDHKNNLCRIVITSGELNNHKIKKAIFKVYHNVDISQNEQTL